MTRIIIFTVLCAWMVAITSIGFAAEKSKLSDAMKKGFKADDGPFKKAIAGKASAAELKQLYGYIETMAAFTPKKGDAAGWKTKTDALLVTTKSLIGGDKTAAAKLKKAGNCKECHKAHKPKKK
jgi:hypothetical protein